MSAIYPLLAGVSVGLWLSHIYPGRSLQLIAGVLIFGLMLRIFLKNSFRPILLIGLFAVCFGVCLSTQNRLRSGRDFAHREAPRECASLEGTVMDLPASTQVGRRSKVKFRMQVHRIMTSEPDCNFEDSPEIGIQQLTIRSAPGRVQVFAVNPPFIPEVGDQIRIFGKLQIPSQPVNPGQVDYGDYLATRRIYSVMRCVGPASMQIVSPSNHWHLKTAIQRTRLILSRRIEDIFGSKSDSTNILKALLLGLRSQLPTDLWRVMMRTGTTHILSISGLHMSLVSAVIYTVWLLVLRSQRKAAFAAVLMVIFYVAIAGASIPVIRAGIMSAALFTGWVIQRPAQSIPLLGWAALIQLILEPEAYRQVSFQLSYLSVLTLLLIRFLPPVHWALEWFRATAMVTAVTLPIVIARFHMVSWSSLIANLWAIPFFNISLVSGFAVLLMHGVPGVSSILAWICELSLKLGLWGLSWLSQWRYGWAPAPEPAAWKMGVYYFLSVVCFLAAKKDTFRWKRGVVFLCLGIWGISGSLFWHSASAEASSATFLADTRLPLVHLRSNGKHWLINAGQGSRKYDAQQRLVPYLQSQGVRRLEGIIITHYSADIISSLNELKTYVTIRCIKGLMPPGQIDLKKLTRDTGIPWKRMSRNDPTIVGGFTIQMSASGADLNYLTIAKRNSKKLYLLINMTKQEKVKLIDNAAETTLAVAEYGKQILSKNKTHSKKMQSLQSDSRAEDALSSCRGIFLKIDDRAGKNRSHCYAFDQWGALRMSLLSGKNKASIKPPQQSAWLLSQPTTNKRLTSI